MLTLLTFENIIICFVALLVGIIFGAIAHKGIVGVIIKLLKLQIDTSKVPFMNLDAVLFTFFLFLLFSLFYLYQTGLSFEKFLTNFSTYGTKGRK